MIETIQKKLNLACPANMVRQRLRTLFAAAGPTQVTGMNYLTVEFHWEAIVRVLAELSNRPIRPEDLRIICVSVEFNGHADVVGNGDRTIHMANIGNYHFIPLYRTRT